MPFLPLFNVIRSVVSARTWSPQKSNTTVLKFAPRVVTTVVITEPTKVVLTKSATNVFLQ